MPVRYMGRNDKWFQENMGIGGRAISLPKREDSTPSETGSTTGSSDPMLESMKKMGIPLTRANYIRIGWPGMKESDLGPELLAEIPKELEE